MLSIVDTREQFRHLLGLYAPIGGAVFVVVVLVLGVVVVRFRGRSEQAISRRTDAPAAEVLYVLGVAVVVAVLLAATYRAESRVDALTAKPALRVDAVASDWRWRFDYPQQGLSEAGQGNGPSELVLPAGETIEFDLSSLDVLHAFDVPYERFQRQAIPGTVNRFDLVFPTAGVQTNGYCNELCGVGHTAMAFEVRVVTPHAFAAWVAEHQGQAGAR